MSRVNLNQPPYHDDYDWAKKYIQYVAIPGRVAQAREFTGMQSAMRNIIKSVGDSILKNGDIIEGCQIIKGENNRITVTSGKVYVEGIVMDVSESVVNITGTGTETIGVRLDEQIIDEFTDETLRDPAQGYANYNQPGCYRLKRTVTVVANDPDAVALATFIDGDQMIESYAPEYDTLTQTLARRTYDESGSYIVEGLRVRTEALNSSEYNVVIEPGKAYVLGYELRIPTARRIRVNRANTYSPVETRKTYNSGTADYQLYSSPFVHDITSVKGIKSVSENQSISNNTDSVQIKESNVLRITSVTQGDNTYTVGGSAGDGDCYLEQIGTTYYVKWNGTTNYPSLGATYTINYEYEKSYVLDTDFQLVLINGGHYLRWVGDTPSNNTVFTVQYNQYLARKDIIYLDRYGYTKSLQGTPAEYNFEVAPEAPLNTLTLAIINNPPNGSVVDSDSTEMISVSNIGLTRFTMNDIQSMLNRIQTIEYDQAVISLNTEARQEDNTLDMKGIFTDPFIDLSRIDLYYNLNQGNKVDSSKPIFDLALDLAANLAYLPIITKTQDITYDIANSTSKLNNRLITLNSSGENVVLSQMNATKSFLINPYSMFPQIPEVAVTPSVDSWIEDTIIEVPRSLQESTIVSMSTRTIDNRPRYAIGNSNYRTNTNTSTKETSIGTRTTSYTTESVLSEKSITYIRQRDITVEGNNFPENLDNIKCYFDGVYVPLTPIEGTAAGTETGSVRSNSAGYLKATFRIPANILTGTREVLLKSDIVRDGYFSEGFTLYVAQGTARNIQRTVTTVTTVLLERVTTTTLTSTYVDPVGQTFVLDKMTMVKGIDVYFENKPTINTPVICEIREVTNGTITSKVYAHKPLLASQVNVSSNASLATRFNFDDPVLLEENKEYAFVLRSTSDSYTVWVAELGGTDVLSNNIVMKNALMAGVMMSSSNNSTWTSHQTQDIKFRLVEDVYAMNSVANFNSITADQFSRILLSADSAIPDGTAVNWMYSLDGNTYSAITPYNIISLSTLNTAFYLRATMSRTGTNNLSPMIAADTIAVTTSCYDLEGNYISRNISGLDPYTKVKIIMDIYEPSGTSVGVKISNNNGNTLVEAVRSDKATTLDYGWREVTFDATLSSSTQCKIFINLKSVAHFSTPAIRRLRVIMS